MRGLVVSGLDYTLGGMLWEGRSWGVVVGVGVEGGGVAGWVRWVVGGGLGHLRIVVYHEVVRV
jgi:hypothetical protein